MRALNGARARHSRHLAQGGQAANLSVYVFHPRGRFNIAGSASPGRHCHSTLALTAIGSMAIIS